MNFLLGSPDLGIVEGGYLCFVCGFFTVTLYLRTEAMVGVTLEEVYDTPKRNTSAEKAMTLSTAGSSD